MTTSTRNEQISHTLAVFANAVFMLTAPKPWVSNVPPSIYERLHDAVLELLPCASTQMVIPVSLQLAYQHICDAAGHPHADLKATVDAMPHDQALALRQHIIDLDAKIHRWGVLEQLPDTPAECAAAVHADGSSMTAMRTSARPSMTRVAPPEWLEWPVVLIAAAVVIFAAGVVVGWVLAG